MAEHPIRFSGLEVRAILDGRKTQTRWVVRPQPTGQPATLHEWVCSVATTLGASPSMEEVASRKHALFGRVFPFRQADKPGLVSPRCPYGVPGDTLWVRETWCEYPPGRAIYRANYGAHTPISDGIGGPWRPSIHMPRWASRLTLRVKDVRVERLQEISEADAMSEGAVRGETHGWWQVAQRDSQGAVCLREGGSADKEPPAWMTDGTEISPPSRIYHTPLSARSVFSHGWDSINGNRAPWSSNPWVWVVEFEKETSHG